MQPMSIGPETPRTSAGPSGFSSGMGTAADYAGYAGMGLTAAGMLPTPAAPAFHAASAVAYGTAGACRAG